MPYQTVGSLHLDFDGINEYNDYYRDLDIEKAIATTRFTANGVTYTREAYTSFPDQVLVIRLTASQKKSISFTAKYSTLIKVRDTLHLPPQGIAIEWKSQRP